MKYFNFGIVSLLGFSVLAFLLTQHHLAAFDTVIIAFSESLETAWLTSVMKFFTFIGETGSVTVIAICTAIFLFVVLKHRWELLLLAVVMTGTGLLNTVLKNYFQRIRPDTHRLIEVGGFSFPSGHAMGAFSFYGILAFILWRHMKTRRSRNFLLVTSILMIIAIGFSRIYLGVHYPSDVLASYFASGFLLSVFIPVFQYVKEKRYEKKQGID